jgi:hypothetical protein
VTAALQHARAILGEWQPRAARLSLDTVANELDRDTVVNGLCVQLEYVRLDFPQNPVTGQPATLRGRLGLAIAGRDPVPATFPGFSVSVTPSGTVETSLSEVFTQDDFSFTVTRASDDQEVTLQINAHLTGFPLNAISQTALVVRGSVRISPTTANVVPGGSYQFSAEVVGLANQAVTWTATGGTISSTGLFTAGNTAGNFTVTATSVANPSKSGQASVSIQSQTPGPSAYAGTYTGTQSVRPTIGQPFEFEATYVVDTPVVDQAGTHIVIRSLSGFIIYQGILPDLRDRENRFTVSVGFSVNSMALSGNDGTASFTFQGTKI